MKIDEKAIQERIELLIQQRSEYLLQAERVVATYDGAIAELKRLLDPPKEDEKE